MTTSPLRSVETPVDERPLEQNGDGSLGARSRRSEQRKIEVLQATVRVIIDRGVESTRFSDVAEASGVPIGTLQYYFGSRDELLLATFRFGTDRLADGLTQLLVDAGGPWDGLRVFIDTILNSFTAESGQVGKLWAEFYRSSLRDSETRQILISCYADVRNCLVDVMARGIASGEFTASADPANLALQVHATANGLVQTLALGDPALDSESARAALIVMVARLVGYAAEIN
jgi:AcrR family transcriptional regulator